MRQPPRLRGPREVGLAALFALAACGGRTAAIRAEVDRTAEEISPRAAAARALGEAGRAAGGGRDDEGSAWLEAALSLRADLHDDTLLREAIGAMPAAALTPVLARERAVEDARSALGSGDEEAARAALRPLAGPDERRARPDLASARAAVLLATIDSPDRPDEARRRLAPIVRGPLEGALGRSVHEAAVLLQAGLDHREERYDDALRGYLRIDPSSGLYREARLGLAFCQLRSGRPERALEVLALLPGGLSGDPERAVLAALAAFGTGHADAARALILEAIERARTTWDPAAVTAEAVLARIAERQDGGLLLRDPDEDLGRTVAWRPSVRRLGRELLAARDEARGTAAGSDLAAYRDALERAFSEAVAAETSAQAARVEAAVRELEALLPRLVAPEEAP